MGTLTELGINTKQATAILVEPPDDVLAEAGSMKPRPNVVNSLMHAAPAAWFVWWPARDDLEPGRLERLHWFLSSVQDGHGWLVVDPDDREDSMTPGEVEQSLAGTVIQPGDALPLSSGEVAVRISPR